MADDNKMTMILDLDSGQFTTKIGDAEQQVQKFGKSSESHFSAAGAKAVVFNQALELVSKAAQAIGFVFNKMGDAISAAAAEEQGILRLNQALSGSGQYSKAATEEIQKYAEGIEKTTALSKDAIFSAAGLASRFTKTAEETKKLTQAAVEFSAATGVSMDMAVRRIGMSLQGSTAQVQKMVPAVKNLTKAQLEHGGAIDLILQKYSGSSANTITTFAGRVTNLEHSYENLLETLGGFITKSPAINAIIEYTSKLIQQLTKFISDWAESGGIERLVNSLLEFGKSIAKFIIAPLELAYNVGELFFNIMRVGVQGIIALAASVERAIVLGIVAPFLSAMEVIASAMAKVFPEKGGAILDYISGLKGQLISETKELEENTHEVLGNMIDDTKKSSDDLFDFSITDKFDKTLDAYSEHVQQMKLKEADFKKSSIDNAKDQSLDFMQIMRTMYGGAKNAAIDFAHSAKQNFENLGKTMFNTVGQGAGRAFAAFGKAVATGGNALEAFTNSLLSTMGDMAVQVGTQMILQGAAYSWAGMPNGPPLMAAGAALAAFGGLLSGAGGSKSAGGASEGSASSSPAGGDMNTKPTETPEMATPEELKSKSASIVIKGDFLNTRESANHLAEILRSNADITDYSITAQGRSYA